MIRQFLLAVAALAAVAVSIPAAALAGSDSAEGPSPAEAQKLLEKIRPVAKQGDPRSQFNLGVLYDHGYGVKRNYETAMSWYRKAASQGYARAQYNIGMMYRAGHGVSQSPREASRWFKRAAQRGEAAAQNNLAVMYARGEGVPADTRKAVHWTARAAYNGNPAASANFPALAADFPETHIAGDHVNIHDACRKHSKVLRQAGPDTRVVVLEHRAQWSRVILADDHLEGCVVNTLLGKPSKEKPGRHGER